MDTFYAVEKKVKYPSQTFAEVKTFLLDIDINEHVVTKVTFI